MKKLWHFVIPVFALTPAVYAYYLMRKPSMAPVWAAILAAVLTVFIQGCLLGLFMMRDAIRNADTIDRWTGVPNEVKNSKKDSGISAG